MWKNTYNSSTMKHFSLRSESLKGNILKKTIVTIILVGLILTSFSVLSVPHVEAQSSDVKILSYSWYTAPTSILAEYVGDLVAVGEVQNTGTSTFGSVWVVGNAYNSTNQAVAATEARVFSPNLAPGQKAPFYLDFAPETSVTGDQSWVSSVVNVTLFVGSTIETNQTQYSGLTTSGVNGYNSAGTYTVIGTVQNNGDQALSDIVIYGTFYDATGKVVALNFTDLVTPLGVGAARPFTLTPIDNTAAISNQIANFSLSFLPIIAPAATPTPTSVTSQPPS